MALPSTFHLLGRDDLPHIPGTTPIAGKVLSAILSMLTIVVLALCLSKYG